MNFKNIFFTTKNQFSKKRSIKKKNVVIFVTVILVSSTMLGSFFEKEKAMATSSNVDYLKRLPVKQNLSFKTKVAYVKPKYDDIKITRPTTKKAIRKRIKKFNKELLIGTRARVRLLGKVVATSRFKIPVRVEIESHQELKSGTILLGNAKVDKISERLHIDFYGALINRKKVNIEAKAFMPDGTFGIEGEYSSGDFKKYGSRFGANFIGGVAKGFKRKSVTALGVVYEHSNLSNAVLNGLSTSFLDYAGDKARENSQPHASIILKDAMDFSVYFY